MAGNQIIFMTGVCGSGKSLIGQLLAKKLQQPYFEADDFHTDESKKKMKKGFPLTDEDRIPWLQKLNSIAVSKVATGAVISCSALKESYRMLLSNNIPAQKIRWVFLDGSYETISKRMQSRSDHFMPESLLQSQFDILEKPKEAIVVDIELTPKEIVGEIYHQLLQK